MISIYVVILLLFYHWIADFFLQTDWQAKNKSTNNTALLEHTTIYAGSAIVPGSIALMLGFISPLALLSFIAFTFIAHTITDYITSRINTYLWKKGDVHNFFVSVGFDQLLHFIQLLITYQIVSQWK